MKNSSNNIEWYTSVQLQSIQNSFHYYVWQSIACVTLLRHYKVLCKLINFLFQIFYCHFPQAISAPSPLCAPSKNSGVAFLHWESNENGSITCFEEVCKSNCHFLQCLFKQLNSCWCTVRCLLVNHFNHWYHLVWTVNKNICSSE